MGLETATYISDLVSTNPAAGDAKSQGDDHIRLVKATVKATFPNVSGAVTATHTELNIMDGVTASTAELNILDGVTASTAELNIMDGVTATTAELNYTDGVTSNIQTQLDGKSDISGETYSGAHNFTAGTVSVATPTIAAHAASKGYADGLAFSAALPAQTGNSGKFVTTDGSAASWSIPGVGDHEVFVVTGNGHGATNTNIRRFTTTQLSVGTAVTYADSAANGATFTINDTAIYSIEYVDGNNASRQFYGVSVNSSQLTTSVYSITASDRLGIAANATDSATSPITVVTKLTAGDVVRPHTDGGTNNTTVTCYFRIRKVAHI